MKIITTFFILATTLSSVLGKQCACPFIADPVCGSDGKTYANTCEFQCEREGRPELLIIYEDECQDSFSKQLGEICSLIYEPVCGTNGKTYGNLCWFNVSAQKSIDLKIAYKGECASKEKNECLVCPALHSPVCASNGRTFDNKCKFDCFVKNTNDLNLRILHFGSCANTNTYQGEYVHCLCTENYEPICGSDGVTYGNACQFECEVRKGKGLTLAYTGECKLKACMCPANYDPVCGTDSVTYPNKCELQCASKNHVVSVQFAGEC